jgi:Ca2+-binding RTX toxin-like protein
MLATVVALYNTAGLTSLALFKEVVSMRRTILLLATMALAVLVVGGVAYALTFTCDDPLTDPDPGGICTGTPEDDRMIGTDGPDVMEGLAGDDKLLGRDNADDLFGNEGSDTLVGGRGGDRIFATHDESSLGGPDTIRAGADQDRIIADNGKADTINCGSGIDTAFVDDEPGGVQDRVGNSCEDVF